MKKIRLLQTVETRCVFDPAEPPMPLNVQAVVGAFETCRAELEGGKVAAVWKLPAGGEIAISDSSADELVGLGYAEPI